MTDFEKWILENHDRLTTYTIEEIVDIAIACGYDFSQIVSWKNKTKWGNAA